MSVMGSLPQEPGWITDQWDRIKSRNWRTHIQSPDLWHRWPCHVVRTRWSFLIKVLGQPHIYMGKSLSLPLPHIYIKRQVDFRWSNVKCSYHKKSSRKLLEVMVTFMALIMVMLSQMYTYLQTQISKLKIKLWESLCLPRSSTHPFLVNFLHLLS